MDKFSNITSKIENLRKDVFANQETEKKEVLGLISGVKQQTEKLTKKSDGIDDRLIEIQTGLATQLNANNVKIQEIEKILVALGIVAKVL